MCIRDRSDPDNGLEPKYYAIQKFTHKFDNDKPFQTELTIQKERVTIPKLLKKRVKFEYEVAENENPNDMDYSHIITFESNSGTHSGTAIDINTKKLYVYSGNQGTWISDNYRVGSNISEIEVRITGSNLSGSKLFISLTGGEPYSEVVFGQTTTKVGSNIRVKVALNSSNAELNAIAVYYKT